MNPRRLQVLGIPGFIGFGLVLFCASFYVGTIAPMRAQLSSVEGTSAKLAEGLHRSEPRGASSIPADVEPPATESKPTSDALEIMRRLNAAAEASAVTIERTSYAIVDKDGARRIEVSLPTKGNYRAIRTYLKSALSVGRRASINSLVLQRARTTDPLLDADLKLSFELDPK